MDWSPARTKPQRTYSLVAKRARIEDDEQEDAIKRRKVDARAAAAASLEAPKKRAFTTLKSWLTDALPSPPLVLNDNAIFSDDLRHCSTPPSSPPPRRDNDSESDTSENAERAYSRYLLPVSGNARSAPIRHVAAKPLIQAQINVGSALQQTCKTCGMTFLRTDAADAALHAKFHSRHLNGVEVGRAFRKWAESRALWRGANGSLIVIVDGRDRAFERRKAQEVLDVVQLELGAVEISETDLWQKPNLGPDATTTASSPSNYRAFLYITGMTCTGLCLAKNVRRAFATKPVVDAEESAWCLGEEELKVEIGISRIWCSKSYRHKSIATALLNAVAAHYKDSHIVAKARVAFSQPTTSGAALARSWFGGQYGWPVYVE